MTTYILIILFSMNSPATLAVEFADEDACKSAAHKMENATTGAVRGWVCTPKATPQKVQ